MLLPQTIWTNADAIKVVSRVLGIDPDRVHVEWPPGELHIVIQGPIDQRHLTTAEEAVRFRLLADRVVRALAR